MLSSRLALFLPFLLPLPLIADDLPTITLRTPAAQMKYDQAVLTAAPGTQVKFVFENLDEMPHNFVLCQPLPDKNDKGLEVAQLAWELGAAGPDKAWIPDSPRIIAHTGMVAAHGKEELRLKIPEKPGIYPYVCTFPGHAMAMNGELRVIAAGPIFTDLSYKLFLGDWQQLPDYQALTPHRSGPLPDKKVTIKLEGMTEHFGVRFGGTLEVAEDGEYEFFLASDDGSDLVVNGQSVIKNDQIHPADKVLSAKVKLKAGPAKVQLDYFEASGGENIYLGWAGPKFSETALSTWIAPGRAGTEAPAPDASQFTGIPLTPENGEAIIYRNFIQDVSPRGIAVGYPNGVNLCFDADQMSPALFWQGAFMDAKRHWTDRGNGAQAPLGYNLFKPAPLGPSVAALPTPEVAWPTKKDRATNLRFRGYRLDTKRFPTFKYDLGSTAITETYTPAGTTTTNDLRVTRTLYFLAPEPQGNLYVRVASGGMKADGEARWTGSGYRLTVDEGTAMLRGDDLLVPVTFTGDTATVAVTYQWIP